LRLLLVPKVILTFQGLRVVRCPTHEHKNLQAFGSNTDRPRKRRDVLLHSVEPIDEEIDCERGTWPRTEMARFMLLVRRSIVLLLVFLFVVTCERGCSVPAPWELGMVMFAEVDQ
jgi:hypothetical protein